MELIITQLITAALGTLGFALLFHINKKYMFFVTLGGMLSWVFYLIFEKMFDGVFLPTMIASILIALYAEILARVMKCPSTPFFAVSMIPLIPGKSLFYTMEAFLASNIAAAGNYALETFSYALGIAAGMSIVWALCDFSRKIAE